VTWLATLLVLVVLGAVGIGLLHVLGLLLAEVRELHRELVAIHGLLDYRLAGRRTEGS
jgi:hypothetical protein